MRQVFKYIFIMVTNRGVWWREKKTRLWTVKPNRHPFLKNNDTIFNNLDDYNFCKYFGHNEKPRGALRDSL